MAKPTAKLVGRASLDGAELLIADVTPGGLGVEFIYSYIISSGSETIIVETGPQSSAEALYQFLEDRGLSSTKTSIIVTHIHLDHSGGAGALAEMLPNAKIYVHPRGARHLVDPAKLWAASRQALGWLAEVYGEPKPAPRERVVETSDGQILVLANGGLRVSFLHTPGHASHHQSVVVETGSKKILFTGDSAGMYSPEAGAVVPTTPPPFRYNAYMSSLDRQIALAPSLVAYTHRGLGGPILLEKHRRQMTLWREVIRAQVARGVVDEKAILQELVKVDEMTRKYIEETGMPALIETLVLLSIKGFLQELRG